MGGTELLIIMLLMPLIGRISQCQLLPAAELKFLPAPTLPIVLHACTFWPPDLFARQSSSSTCSVTCAM